MDCDCFVMHILLFSSTYICTLLWLLQHIPENVILNIIVYFISVFIIYQVCDLLAASQLVFGCFSYITQPKYMTLAA